MSSSENYDFNSLIEGMSLDTSTDDYSSSIEVKRVSKDSYFAAVNYMLTVHLVNNMDKLSSAECTIIKLCLDVVTISPNCLQYACSSLTYEDALIAFSNYTSFDEELVPFNELFAKLSCYSVGRFDQLSDGFAYSDSASETLKYVTGKTMFDITIKTPVGKYLGPKYSDISRDTILDYYASIRVNGAGVVKSSEKIIDYEVLNGMSSRKYSIHGSKSFDMMLSKIRVDGKYQSDFVNNLIGHLLDRGIGPMKFSVKNSSMVQEFEGTYTQLLKYVVQKYANCQNVSLIRIICGFVRKGTLFDEGLAKDVNALYCKNSSGIINFYDSVVAKLGNFWDSVVTKEDHIVLCGVTRTGPNMMLRGILNHFPDLLRKNLHLFDTSDSKPPGFADEDINVIKYEFKEDNFKKFFDTYIKDLTGKIFFISDVADNLNGPNKYSDQFERFCSNQKNITYFLKRLVTRTICMAQKSINVCGRGRLHNGEFFTSNGPCEQIAYAVYAKDMMFANVTRGHPRPILCDVAFNYPTVSRPLNLSNNSAESRSETTIKWKMLLSRTASESQFDEIAKLTDVVKFSELHQKLYELHIIFDNYTRVVDCAVKCGLELFIKFREAKCKISKLEFSGSITYARVYDYILLLEQSGINYDNDGKLETTDIFNEFDEDQSQFKKSLFPHESIPNIDTRVTEHGKNDPSFSVSTPENPSAGSVVRNDLSE